MHVVFVKMVLVVWECCECPPPPSGCFPSTARMTLESGKSVTMSELQTGDRVQAGEDIYLFSNNILKENSTKKRIGI